MSDPVFVVLRAHSDTVQTVGLAGQAFTSFEEADAFAKEMRDRYTQRSFYLCQAIAMYEVQGRATVESIALPEPEQTHAKTTDAKESEPIESRSTAELNPQNEPRPPAEPSSPIEPGAPNVYPMPTRFRAGE